MGGIGAATGPLIGGFLTTAISWRVAFVFQAAIIVVIVVPQPALVDPVPADPNRPFESWAPSCPRVGLFCSSRESWPPTTTDAMVVLLIAGTPC